MKFRLRPFLFFWLLLKEMENSLNKVKAKPFLKWAGGKTQLISEIEKSLPSEIFTNNFVYVEPFIGSGAILFWILNNFPNVEKVIINDVNSDLINVYKTIQSNPNQLIDELKILQNQFYDLLTDEEKKKEFYCQKRETYNKRESEQTEQAALFIFLNRTCFNGLYRVNKSNKFNVPIGSYKKPRICDEQNILSVSETLKNVEILNGDFEKTQKFAQENSLFYIDPPYKPLNSTSSFNSYAKDEFTDNEQVRLKSFCDNLTANKVKWILSNSDVKNENSQTSFFDKLYKNYFIKRVEAKRNINSKGNKRGKYETVSSSY